MEKEKFDFMKYKNEYTKKHYVRKSIIFKKEEYPLIEEFLKKNNTTLKAIIFEKIFNDSDKH